MLEYWKSYVFMQNMQIFFSLDFMDGIGKEGERMRILIYLVCSRRGSLELQRSARKRKDVASKPTMSRNIFWIP